MFSGGARKEQLCWSRVVTLISNKIRRGEEQRSPHVMGREKEIARAGN